MKVDRKIILKAPADQVWDVVGDFNGLPRFVPAAVESVVDGEGVGALRTVTLPDGSKLVERLESVDPAARTYSYSIVSGPLPVAKYFATVRVTPMDLESCEVTWTGSFEPSGDTKEAQKAIEGVYDSGLRGLAQIFGA